MSYRVLAISALAWVAIVPPALAQAAAAPTPPPPDKEITIKLPVAQWDLILQSLGNQPFDKVQGLIAEMQRQAMPQIAPAPPPDKKGEKR